MSPDEFENLVGEVTARIAGRALDGPGSAHRPTVEHGQALILYLLPRGAIDFTRHSARDSNASHQETL